MVFLGRRLLAAGLLAAAGCAKPRVADLLAPAAGVTSVSGRCMQVDNEKFPENRAFAYVEDQNRTALQNFSVGNFAAAEEGKPVPVYKVQAVDATADPLSAVIVLDQSGSMSGTTGSGATRMTVGKAAAKAFVALLGASDACEIVLFDNVVTVPQAFTSDKTALNAAIDGATPGGATAVYDAAGRGVGDIAARRGRKVVIVLTDGSDNSSSTYGSPTALADFANEKGVPVYTIGIVTGGLGADPDAMKTIANLTGGEYFGDDQGDLTTQFQRIYTQLSSLVEVHFKSLIAKKPRTLKLFLTYGSLTATLERKYSF